MTDVVRLVLSAPAPLTHKDPLQAIAQAATLLFANGQTPNERSRPANGLAARSVCR
jgi:hypothetical protein